MGVRYGKFQSVIVWVLWGIEPFALLKQSSNICIEAILERPPPIFANYYSPYRLTKELWST